MPDVTKAPIVRERTIGVTAATARPPATNAGSPPSWFSGGLRPDA
jgi:hypothetical protein